MTFSLNAMRAHEKWEKGRGNSPSGWFPRIGWKPIDPLYMWSAAVGLVVAFVLVAIGVIMQTRQLH